MMMCEFTRPMAWATTSHFRQSVLSMSMRSFVHDGATPRLEVEGHAAPGKSFLHERAARLREPAPSLRIAQERHHCVRKIVRAVREHEVLARHHGQPFRADGGGD